MVYAHYWIHYARFQVADIGLGSSSIISFALAGRQTSFDVNLAGFADGPAG